MFTETRMWNPLQPKEFKVYSYIVHPEIRLNKTKNDRCSFSEKSAFLCRGKALTGERSEATEKIGEKRLDKRGKYDIINESVQEDGQHPCLRQIRGPYVRKEVQKLWQK